MSVRKPALSFFLALTLLFLGENLVAQDLNQRTADSILQQGYELYQLQLAGIYSSRFIEEKLSTEELSGTIVYPLGDTIHVLYLNGIGKKSGIQYHFTFNRPVSPEFIRLAPPRKKMDPLDKKLIKVRNNALQEIFDNDEINQQYIEFAPSLVYIPKVGSIEVYLFSGQQKDGHVPLGNDARLSFNTKGKFKSLERLHQNFIPIPGRSNAAEQVPGYDLSSMHVHAESSSPYMTSTDIATLLLYGDYVDWKDHFVFSPTFVTYFSIPEKRITIISKEDYQRLNQGGQ